MAERVEVKAATFAAGTLASAPSTVALSWLPGVVRRVEIVVPPGPSGVMGFQILHSAQRIIPFGDDIWIVTDDEPLGWDLSGYPTGDAWAIRGYNTGLFDHTVYMRWFLDEIPSQPQSGLVPLPIG